MTTGGLPRELHGRRAPKNLAVAVADDRYCGGEVHLPGPRWHCASPLNGWVLTRGAPCRAQPGTGAPSACSTLLGGVPLVFETIARSSLLQARAHPEATGLHKPRPRRARRHASDSSCQRCLLRLLASAAAAAANSDLHSLSALASKRWTNRDQGRRRSHCSFFRAKFWLALALSQSQRWMAAPLDEEPWLRSTHRPLAGFTILKSRTLFVAALLDIA